MSVKDLEQAKEKVKALLKNKQSKEKSSWAVLATALYQINNIIYLAKRQE